MASLFPTALPEAKTNYDNADPIASSDQNEQSEDINAIAAKVGADSSAVTTSHDYKLSGVTGSDKATSRDGSETLTNKTLTSPVLNTQVTGTAVLDEDNMASNSALKVATQQSIKAYVDTAVGGVTTDLVGDTSPQLGGDLDLNGKNIDFPTTANVSDCLDEDNMASDSATKLATQQSIKAYADTKLPKASPTISSGNLTVPDASDIVFTSGAKIERADGHLALTPETNKLVKVAVLNQNNTTNAYVNNSVILTGWGWQQASTSAAYFSETVTFGITFSARPEVLISDIGNIDSEPAHIGSFNNWNAGYCTNVATYAITTTNFGAIVHMVLNNGAGLTNFPNTRYYGYSWFAIGPLD